MKNIFKLTLVIATLALVGCGGGKKQKFLGQDPLEGYPDSVKNGLPPTEKLPKPDRRPLPEDAYRVEVDDVVEFGVGQELSVEVVARVYVQVKEFKLEVQNLSKFPEAKFEQVDVQPDAIKYKFTWKAPESFTGNNLYVTTSLDFRLTADTGVITSYDKSIKVMVNRSFKTPRILSAKFNKYEVVEGDDAVLTVEVEDNDSTENEPTRIVFDKPSYYYDGSVFLKFMSITRDAATGKFTVQYSFNTGGRDITDNSAYTTVTVVAVSRYGVKSQSSSPNITINNSLKPAVSSISPTSVVSFTLGQRNSTSFTFMDSRQEGTVSATLKTDTSALPGSVIFSCVNPTGAKYVANCTLIWDVAADAQVKAGYKFDFEIINEGKSGYSTVKKTSQATLRVEFLGVAGEKEWDNDPVVEPDPDTGSNNSTDPDPHYNYNYNGHSSHLPPR